MSQDNVIEFDGVTRLNIPADRVLEQAKGVDCAVVVGWNSDGQFYFASSLADGGEVIVLLELARRKLVDIIEDGAA